MELTLDTETFLHALRVQSFRSKAVHAARRVNEAWGARTVGDSTVHERFRELRAGNEDLEVKPRAGRPCVLDEGDLQAALTRKARTNVSVSRVSSI